MLDWKDLIGTKAKPLLDMPFPMPLYGPYVTRPSSYDDVERLIKRCPEALGIISGIKTDIQGAGVVFEGPQYKVKIAREFFDSELVKIQIDASMTDWIMFGDGYLWVGNIEEFLKNPEIARRVNKSLEKFSDRSADSFSPLLDQALKQINDEERLVRVAHVSARTMNIDYDNVEVMGYRQIVNQRPPINFEKSNIIHFKYMTVTGNVYGYSPFLASLSELQVIGFIKDFTGGWFNNGGAPDILFMLKNEQPNSPTVDFFTKQLQKYKNPQTKRGNLVTTGEIGIEKLNELEEGMQFRMHYVTMVGAMASGFNLPISRLLQVMGKDMKSGATSSDFEMDGYYNMIEEKQVYWETLLNSQLWTPFFGVKMKFKRGYMQQRIRQVQALSQAMPVVTQMLKDEYPVSDNYLFSLLRVDEQDRTEESFDKVKEKLKEMQEFKEQATFQRSDKETIEGPNKQAEAERKRKVARNMGQNS